ncbi:heterodisulfide reductase-related iron-sulfur binding cluster, partial [Nonomuraea sp. NPDC055795]
VEARRPSDSQRHWSPPSSVRRSERRRSRHPSRAPSRQAWSSRNYHDPCRLNKRKGVWREPRELLRAIPGLTFTDVDRVTQWSYCSGAGGGLPIEKPELTARISASRIDKAAELGVDTLVSACPWSERPLSEAGRARSIDVVDLFELLATSLGVAP